MSKNYLTQVVWLFVLTVVILLIISVIPPIEINHTTKQVDILSSIRSETEAGETSTSNAKADTSKGNKPLQKSDSDTSEQILADETNGAGEEIEPTRREVPRKLGDITLIEDYTPDNNGMKHFAQAIERRKKSKRPVRIAFLGDSFIEADILTQNIRETLQDLYGGCGVGYMAMHSDFPGFRRSVNQVDKGWKTHSVATKFEGSYTSLPLLFHRASNEAHTSFKGVDKLNHIDQWEVSTIGFIADGDATITMKTDSTTHTYDITADDDAQFITLREVTSSLEVRCNSSNVAMWGTWLDGNNGIAVDNISIRGYSGTTIQELPLKRLKQLNENIPYDLIVLQYGLNRMSKNIKHYEPYTKQLNKAVAHLKEAYPNADILIMGVGDRCEKQNDGVKTMEAIYGMIEAQRNAAIESECLFWDTYEAMQTLGGMPEFVNNKWANKDYTHINHNGGKPLSDEFVKALNHAIGK